MGKLVCGVGYEVRGTGYGVRGAGCWMLGAPCPTGDAIGQAGVLGIEFNRIFEELFWIKKISITFAVALKFWCGSSVG
jgi:hypothetical protein